MRTQQRIILYFAFALLAFDASAAVLIDDDWDDGDRTETNLPEESAWYGSTAAGTTTLSAVPGALTGHVRVLETNTSSRLWITHFTPDGSPGEVTQDGDRLKATLVFVPTNVTTLPETDRGLRIGLFSFSEVGAARVSADGFSTGTGGGAPGANVIGYMLNMNFAQAFTINNPIEIMKRTDTTNINLMGASGVFTRVGTTGGGISGTPGFSNGVPYTLEFAVQLLGASVDITIRIYDTNGWSIAHTVTDSTSLVTRFDSLAIRPSAVTNTADALTFTRFKVEVIPFLPRITSVVLNPEQLSSTVSWEALVGKSYQLEAAERIDDPDWTVVNTVTAGGKFASVDDLDAFFYERRFYRVQQLP